MIILIILLDYKSEIITATGCPFPGVYGENFSIPCPHNCHIVEGTCLGCLPGYRGVTCNDGNEKKKQLALSIRIISYLQIRKVKNQFSDLLLFKVHSVSTTRIT